MLILSGPRSRAHHATQPGPAATAVLDSLEKQRDRQLQHVYRLGAYEDMSGQRDEYHRRAGMFANWGCELLHDFV